MRPVVDTLVLAQHACTHVRLDRVLNHTAHRAVVDVVVADFSNDPARERVDATEPLVLHGVEHALAFTVEDAIDLAQQLVVRSRRVEVHLVDRERGEDFLLQFVQRRDHLARVVDRLDHLGLWHLIGTGLNHHDRVLGPGDHEVEVSLFQLLVCRECLELTVDAPDADGRNGRLERDV